MIDVGYRNELLGLIFSSVASFPLIELVGK